MASPVLPGAVKLMVAVPLLIVAEPIITLSSVNVANAPSALVVVKVRLVDVELTGVTEAILITAGTAVRRVKVGSP